MKPEKKSVVLVDFHAAGHHPTYLELFSKAIGDSLAAVSAPPSGALESVPARVKRLETFVPRWSRLWRWRGREVLICLERFLFFSRLMKRFEKEAGTKIEHVIFACLYDGEFKGAQLWKSCFRWPWSALYLHPVFQQDGKMEKRPWMKHPNLVSIGLLDETRIEELKTLSGKPVVRMPDAVFADSVASVMQERVSLLKRGRFTVILSGFLHPQKGVVTFLDLVDRLDPKKFFFVLVGAVHLPDFSEMDQSRLLRFSQESENGFAYYHRIESERVLNGLIDECDLVFASYSNWRFSSNAVGKAASFRKPIVVTAGELMGERVEEFSLGFSVSEGDVSEIEHLLIRLEENRGTSRIESDHALMYLHQHSVEAFHLSVAKLVSA